MCGIFGIVSRRGLYSQQKVQEALLTLTHRGPDDFGIAKFQIRDTWDLWLAHARLSVIDISSAGHQPMIKHDDRTGQPAHAIVFNGEIYNHSALKQPLKSQWNFVSKSDTEVLQAGIALEGPSFLEKLNGMLALAYFDFRSESLIIARDRIGKKPLYVYQTPDLMIFSSELKPIWTLGVNLAVDNEAMSFYRWLGYVPGTMSIYKQCQKFPAGSYGTLSLKGETLDKIVPQQYWDPFIGYKNKFKGTFDEAKENLQSLLDDAVRLRLESDVPLGVFLSGGIDSSLVLSSVVASGRKDIQGFTVRFEDPDLDESSVALDTARQLGVNLNILDLHQRDFDRQVALIPRFYDEPFSDSSQVATLAIAELAKKHVSVVLTGDGGDEVFLGYPRYSHQSQLRKIIRLIHLMPALPDIFRFSLNTSLGKQLFKKLLQWKGMASAGINIDSNIIRVNQLLAVDALEKIYESVMCVTQKAWMDSGTRAALGHVSLHEHIKNWYPRYGWEYLNDRSFHEYIAALDLVTYMRDDVLVKVDRGTMAYGLEARSPLLDYRIVEFGCSLPLEFKIKNGTHKHILRSVLSDRLKGNIIKLGKKGFGVPIPNNLPEGKTPYARWNKFIETQWQSQYSAS
jgi:asparagine synthase (glutamine-hydrolysing)